MAWLTADEALALLGGKRQTLYANVSRGRIRAKADPRDARKSLYNSADVTRLAGRKAGRRTAQAVATEAIGWGDPVLASGISTVADGTLWYRGRDAVALAREATLEQVADLLWQMKDCEFRVTQPARQRLASAVPMQAALSVLAGRASADPPSLGRARNVLVGEAATLVGELAAAMLTDVERGPLYLHQRIAEAWGVPQTEDILRRSLVLLAEHELNASTFAVRVTASTGASLAACLLSGLATLTGPLHGGASAHMRALAAAARRDGAQGAVRDWLARGHPIPAFGHPLYPDGDPRARALLVMFELPRTLADLRAAAEDLSGEQPNVDFALMALTSTFNLPDTAPLTLFALARSIGWLAHAMEQAATGSLIRPRARYNGPALGPSSGSALAREPDV